MALIKVAPTRVTEIFIAEEPIGALTTVCLSSPGKKIRAGSSTTQQWVAGATIAGGVSGGPVRVVTHGVVSGIICGALVSAGDRVTCFTSGKITPLNTITPDISGRISAISGLITNVAASITAISGYITNVSGSISITAISGYITNVSGYISAISGYITDVAASITAISGYITAVSGWINLISGTTSGGLVGVDGASLSVSGIGPLSGLAGVEIIGQPQFQSGRGSLSIDTQPGFRSGAGLLAIQSQPGFQSGAGTGLLAVNNQPQFQSGRGSLSIDTQPSFQSGAGLIALTAQSFNTARILGKALDNGGVGSGIRVMVSIGG